ncbi:hypothetical protein V6N00_13455 [Tersicoccus sp. MR15.9]|uniref:hypothetical protein n=1 Tax=Tersicoccus mangrovi TaxID=3121635 RepID=UPI002FE68A19
MAILTPDTEAPTSSRLRLGKGPRPPRAPRGKKADAPAPAPEAIADGTGKHRAEPKAAPWPDPVRPSLILLPTKLRGARARRRASRHAALLSIAALALTGIAYAGVTRGTTGAAGRLAAQQQITAQHEQYLAANTGFETYYEGFVASKAAVAGAFDGDLAYTSALNAMNTANTVGAVFTKIASTGDGQTCARGNVFTPSTAIGCLQVEGRVHNLADVGRLAAAIGAAKKNLTDPYVTESTHRDGVGTFKMTVGFTADIYSFKGAKFTPTDEEKAAAAPTDQEAGQ